MCTKCFVTYFILLKKHKVKLLFLFELLLFQNFQVSLLNSVYKIIKNHPVQFKPRIVKKEIQLMHIYAYGM
jgi:hypothetical protein